VFSTVLAILSIALSGAAFVFSVWTWRRTRATARWDRWRDKLSAAFRDDALSINRSASKELTSPLLVESGPLTRQFPATVEVLKDLPSSLLDKWVGLLQEAISLAGSDGVLWWEVYLYSDRPDSGVKLPSPLRLSLEKGSRPGRV